MSQKNYMAFGDAETIFTDIASKTKNKELTQEQYDALTEEEKHNGTVYYIVDGVTNTGQEVFVGTHSEWEELTSAEKARYKLVTFTDDTTHYDTIDSVTNGDMRAVTSNAVYDAVSAISPVDALTNNEMKPVTSNAVFDEFENRLSGTSILRFSTENSSKVISLSTAFRGILFISAYADNHEGIVDVRCDNSDNVAISRMVGATAVTFDTSQSNQITISTTGYAVHGLLKLYGTCSIIS